MVGKRERNGGGIDRFTGFTMKWKFIVNEIPEQKRASQKLLNVFWHLERADPK